MDQTGGNGGRPSAGATAGDPARSLGAPTALLWAVLVAFHLWASSRIGGPSVVFDESGYLGNARWLTGGSDWQMPRSPTYASGYPLVLAAVLAWFDDADSQWRAVLVVNALLLASVLPLLRLLLTRVLGVAERPALAAATVGALAPAVVAAGVSAIAENLVLPLVALSVVAAWAMVGRPAGRGAWPYGYGLTVAALATTHPRFTTALPVAAVALLVGWRRGLLAPRVAAVNGALLVVATGLGRALNDAVQDARWSAVERLEGDTSSWADLVRTSDGFHELWVTAAGQAWYLAAGSLGLAVVGAAALVRIVATQRGDDRDRSRRTDPGDDRGLAPTAERARRFAVAVTLAMALAVFVSSVVFFAQNQFRADHWVYGRHNDSFSPIWVAVALTTLAVRPLRRALLDLAGAAAAIAVLGSVVIAQRDPSELGDSFSPFAVPALVRAAGSDPTNTFVRATVIALVALLLGAALLALVRSAALGGRPPLRHVVAVALTVGLAATSAYSGFGSVRGTERFERLNSAGWHVPQELRRLGIPALAIEGRTARSLPTLTYPFHLPELDVSTYEAALGEQPVGPYALARLDDPRRREAGDRAVLLDEGGLYGFWDAPSGLAVWVAPGPDQDRLGAEGLLLPDGFPTALPPSSRRARLRLVRGPEPAVVAPGGTVEVEVVGRHLGTGSPWPDVAGFSLPGRVAIGGRVTDPGTGAVVLDVVVGELDRWVVPGGAFRAVVRVTAVDGQLAPLAPGRYDVQLDVRQVGETWTAPGGEPARFVLEVAR